MGRVLSQKIPTWVDQVEERFFVERNLHEVGTFSTDGVTPSYESPECFIAYGTEVGLPALPMNLGPSDYSINPIHTSTTDVRPTFQVHRHQP